MLGIIMQDNNDEARIEYYLKNAISYTIIPSAITFYAFYFILFPNYLQNKKILRTVVYGLLISGGAALIGTILLDSIEGNYCEEQGGDMSLFAEIISMTIIALISGIVALIIKGFITWFEEIKLKDMLKQKNHEMEMALVKSQLDPHFLFNTINNIDVLILKNAVAASDYLNKLSDIMRFMLFETKTDKILLSKELAYIEKYLELQKIRTANAHYVHFQVTGMAGKKTIAPMVFIPFIENAFKHTSNKKIENAICIRLLIKEESIQLLCENKFNPNLKTQQESNGLGNDLIQKRLHLIYPGKHTLEVSNQNGVYSVNLTIYHG